MKTLILKSYCLSLLLLVTACGKAPNEAEELPPVVENTTEVPEVTNSNKELKDLIAKNDLDGMQKVIRDNVIDIKDAKFEGETPLITAIKNDAVKVRDYLLERGANIEEKSDKGETPLMVAAAYNRINSAEILLKRKVSLDKKNQDGDTALHIALKKKHEDMALLLIQYGANIKISDKDNLNAFDIAEDNKLAQVEQVVRKMMQVEIGSPDLYSFRETLVSGDLISLTQMLRKFPNLGSTFEAINPLSLTINVKKANDGQNMAYLLLINKTNVNGPANADYSPLIRAVILQKQSFVELFLNHNANVHLVDKEGRSALAHAVAFNNLEMVDSFLARKAKVEYEYKVNGKKGKIDVCDINRAVGKKAKDKKAFKAIKKKLDCGFFDRFF